MILSQIAKQIIEDWKNPSPYAMPYLEAMLSIHSEDPYARYYLEDAQTVVLYFLANAQTWRGPKAREIKQILRKQYTV